MSASTEQDRSSFSIRRDLHGRAQARASGEGKTLQFWYEQAVLFALRHMDISGRPKALKVIGAEALRAGKEAKP